VQNAGQRVLSFRLLDSLEPPEIEREPGDRRKEPLPVGRA